MLSTKTLKDCIGLIKDGKAEEALKILENTPEASSNRNKSISFPNEIGEKSIELIRNGEIEATLDLLEQSIENNCDLYYDIILYSCHYARSERWRSTRQIDFKTANQEQNLIIANLIDLIRGNMQNI